MFALSSDDLHRRILGCADGPASFNAEATTSGLSVVSCDPLYRFTTEQIGRRIAETCDIIIEQTRRNQDEFVWTSISSVEELRQLRMASMDKFLADYELGKEQGRYVVAELPQLPFRDGAFDLALCSHFLFLYSEQFTTEFHVVAIRELQRVASEVRIFPLLALGAKPSPHVSFVKRQLETDGWHVGIEVVPYEFQRGGNQMMRVWRNEERDRYVDIA